MSVPIIGVEPALVGMLSAAESAGAATRWPPGRPGLPGDDDGATPGSDPASMAVAAALQRAARQRSPR